MDISVYDNYSGSARDFDFFFIDGKYKVCDSMLAIICMSGRATFTIRLNDHEIEKAGYLVIRPETPFYIKAQSADFKIDVVRIGGKIFEELSRNMIDLHPEWFIYDYPSNKLPWNKARMFHIIHSYMGSLLTLPKDWYRDQLIKEYLRIFYLEACHIWEENSINPNMTVKRERKITCDFFRLADKNFREDRKVDSYAEKIGISAKHLAATIKNTTGKYPSDWLDDYVLLEAKKQLRESDNSIQNISFDLNFATPSHFGRFFKSKTGMTPKEFRQKEFIIVT